MSILLSSLRQFADGEPFDRIRVIVPHNEASAARELERIWDDLKVEVVAEDDLLPQLKEIKRSVGLRPWHFQQIIKLGAAATSERDFILLADPDVVATRRFGSTDLTRSGRSLIHLEDKAVHPAWWNASSRLLDVPNDPVTSGFGVTPQILSARVCADLLNSIEQQYDRPWHLVLKDNSHRIWTEYSLYSLYCEDHGLFDRYHIVDKEVGVQLLSEANVWTKQEFSESLLRRAFAAESQGIFSVVQSAAMIPAEEVAAIIGDYVELYLWEAPTLRRPRSARLGAMAVDKLRGSIRKLIFLHRAFVGR